MLGRVAFGGLLRLFLRLLVRVFLGVFTVFALFIFDFIFIIFGFKVFCFFLGVL